MTPADGVHIPATQTYAEVQDLVRTVGRIEAKVDRVLDEAVDIRGDIGDHETRLRAVEQGRTERQRAQTSRIDQNDARITAVERRMFTVTGAIGTLCTVAGYLAQYLIP
ncbi:hypothetical protein AB0M23_32295 [Streptomyces sp. NPDC052077]|uniref:hypothetical protein n=1 Tax=Streptomyces sp. NPDC052077 TaxID=3154757 RepID=UPI003447F50E